MFRPTCTKQHINLHYKTTEPFKIKLIAQSLVLCVVFCRSLFVLCFFPLAIVLSVLRCTASDYPFGIFNLFLLPTLPEHLSSSPGCSGVRVTPSLVLYVCFVDRYFFFWPLCCLFFDLRILITPLVSSNSFYVILMLSEISLKYKFFENILHRVYFLATTTKIMVGGKLRFFS